MRKVDKKIQGKHGFLIFGYYKQTDIRVGKLHGQWILHLNSKIM